MGNILKSSDSYSKCVPDINTECWCCSDSEGDPATEIEPLKPTVSMKEVKEIVRKSWFVEEWEML